MGQSLEAFVQWKALVSLLLSCSEAVSTMLFLILMSIVIISSDILKDRILYRASFYYTMLLEHIYSCGEYIDCDFLSSWKMHWFHIFVKIIDLY
jgi:hypothetical protein